LLWKKKKWLIAFWKWVETHPLITSCTSQVTESKLP